MPICSTKKKIFKNIFKASLCLLLLTGGSAAFGQSGNSPINKSLAALQSYAAINPTEKVHLHLDRPWYNPGDTIWFKAYAVAGQFHEPSTISNVLYAELINPNDSLVRRLVLRMDFGVSRGNFALPDSLACGIYRIRAYTNWMRNDSAYFYDQKVVVGCVTPGLQAASGGKSTTAATVTAAAPAGDDIQFLPEGGDLVEGLRAKVAIKAIDEHGLGTDANGTVTDETGAAVASFSTQHAGMGAFAITPQAGKQYNASVTFANGTTKQFSLPRAKAAGFTLTLNNAADTIYLKIAQNNALYSSRTDTACYIIAQAGGQQYYAAAANLSQPVFTAKIDKSRFPSGIVQFTLFSQSGEPLNQRAVFIQNDDQLALDAIADKPAYQPNDSVKIAIAAKNKAGKTTIGSFSLAVTNETDLPADEPAEATIFTDLLLTGDLKGYVEKPNYYFIDPTDQTRADLDLLMLTQGYSRFNWQKILSPTAPAPAFKPETGLHLSGVVKTMSNKVVPGGSIRLTSIKDYFSADTLTDANGNFTFKNLGFADSTKVIINAKKLNGGNSVKIIIHQPAYAAINSTAASSTVYAGGLSTPVVAAVTKANADVYSTRLQQGIQLKEVKIKAQKTRKDNTMESKQNFMGNLNGVGNADFILKGDRLVGCPILTDCLSGRLFGVTFLNGVPYSTRAQARNFKSIPMAVFIDGIQASPEDLQYVNADDIYDVEVLTSGAYLAIYGSNAGSGAIMINLKHGGSIDITKIPVDGLISYAFKGYQKIRQFYVPRYSAPLTGQSPAPLTTTFWNPDVITDSAGKATVKYITTGNKGTYRVVIEGVDTDGNLGRKVFRYKVE